MKTRAQFLLMGLLSIVPLFPQESEARLFVAHLIGIEQERCNKFNSAIHTKAQTTQDTSALGVSLWLSRPAMTLCARCAVHKLSTARRPDSNLLFRTWNATWIVLLAMSHAAAP